MTAAVLAQRLNAKESRNGGWLARCPSHDDKKASLSIGEGRNGTILLNCFAGCSLEDILSALDLKKPDLFPNSMRATNISTNSAKPPPARKPPLKISKFDWRKCVEAMTDKHIEHIAKWRGLSPSFVRSLRDSGLMGIYNGLVAFPVENKGKIVGAHVRKKDGSWFYIPKGIKAAPMMFGDPATCDRWHIFESTWDGLSFMDRSGERDGILITRGAKNGAFVAGRIPEGAIAWLWQQNDEPDPKTEKRPGEEWTKGVCKNAPHSATLNRVPIPAHDLNDWIRDGATDNQLIDAIGKAETLHKQTEVAVTSPETERVKEFLASKKTTIQLPGDYRLVSAFAADLAEVLKDCGIYERGNVAVIVNRRGDGVEVITSAMLRSLVERHLVCYRVRHDGAQPIRTMSRDDAEGVLSSRQFLDRLPSLLRIATARLPVLRANGKIELLPDGYDRESCTLTLSQCSYGDSMSLQEAIAVIDDLFSEFSFADERRSKSVAIAAAVALYVVGLLPKEAVRAVIIYLANAEGAGKTLCAKCAISPTHGLVRTDGDLKDKTETAKELLAVVIEGRPYILFDNCKGHLDSAQLEAFVNAPIWSGRILGVSKMFAGENIVNVLVTGNKCTISPDMRRRALIVELFMEAERAEDRVFRRILDDEILLKLRPRILAALWAFVREWDKAGRPGPSREHSSFPRWAKIIGGIVEFAGYGCPLVSADIDAAADLDGADMHELATLPCPVKFDEIVELAREHGLFERIIGVEGDLTPSQKSKLGKLLKRYDGRIFAQGRFVIEGKGRAKTYRVVPVKK